MKNDFDLTKQIEQHAKKTVENDGVVLLSYHKFYAYLLIELSKTFTTEVELAAVNQINGKNNLFIHPKNYPNLPLRERLGVLIHELDHLILKHPLIMVKYDKERKIWNIATDIFINPNVPNNEKISLPKGALYPEKFELPNGLSTDEYYEILKNNQEKIPKNIWDNLNKEHWHQTWEKSEGNIHSTEDSLKKSIEKALKKTQGQTPNHLKRYISNIIEPKVNWKSELGSIIGIYIKSGEILTWKKECRRLGKGFKGKRKLTSLSIGLCIDTSISISQEKFEEFAGHIHSIYKSKENMELFIIECDSEIKQAYYYKGQIATLFDKEVVGGGTDFRPPFKYLKEKQKKFDLIIYLTDGFGYAPTTNEIPTIWVLTENGSIPKNEKNQDIDWGKFIFMK